MTTARPQLAAAHPPSSLRAVFTVLRIELRRRLLDRSAVINAFVAPLVISTILGFAFGGHSAGAVLRIGLVVEHASRITTESGADRQAAAVADSGVGAAGLPPQITVVRFTDKQALNAAVDSGSVAAGVVVPPAFGTPSSILPDLVSLSGGAGAKGPTGGAALSGSSPKLRHALSDLLAGVVSGSERHARHHPVVSVVSSSSSSLGSQVAGGLASAITSRLYSGALVALNEGGTPTTQAALSHFEQIAARAAAAPLAVGLAEDPVGARHSVVGYFAPSMAVVFLFIGAGLGARALLVERTGGTLARLAAAPVRSGAVVVGKMAAVFMTSLMAVFTLWGETVLLFGASWGDPLGVTLMCIAITLAMCSLSMFLTSLSKSADQAFAATAIVGIVLGLFGGNFFPPGSLPPLMQDLTLATPNGWALVGFGRLSLEGLSAAGVVGPVIVLVAIGAVFSAASLVRMGRIVEL